MAAKKQQKLGYVSIEAVANGFKVSLNRPSQGTFAEGCVTYTITGFSPMPETLPAPHGDHVFADFASLTIFLKTYLKHAKGIEQ